MAERTVTIGRYPGCNHRIPRKYELVSNKHCEIREVNGSLYLTDYSSNGTIINGRKIHNAEVRIEPGDRIFLAKEYYLDWDTINSYFPELNGESRQQPSRPQPQPRPQRQTEPQPQYQRQPQPSRGPRPTENIRTAPGSAPRGPRKTEAFDTGSGINRGYPSDTPAERCPANPGLSSGFGRANEYSQAEIDAIIGSWNWGAFLCSWIWAAFNRIYWPLLVLIVAAVPYLGQVCSLCLAVYLGLNGSKMAWRKDPSHNFEKFARRQRMWTIIGAVLFVIMAVSTFFVLKFTLELI